MSLIILCIYMFFLQKDEIAYVDSSKIIAEFKGAEEAKKAFEQKTKSWKLNIDSLTTEVQNSIKKYEKDLATMPVKEQQLSKQLLDSKQKQLLDYQNAIRQKAQQEDGKLSQNVVAQINAYLVKYGKSHQYKLILIANQSGTIAYAREGLDITKDVIEGLNNDYTNGR
ncbi:hypothetical protein OC25_07930 [Pedobacter kyungheensis]|uniref:Molecular chaperone Skp n=1 Tax=Pedobacter kyungheensis TaxID=1069985 RepID=A0A0C1FTY5_9SPHI|nr:hypothetical protein OC25_07930 [Pedobacter kyungheensis]